MLNAKIFHSYKIFAVMLHAQQKYFILYLITI